MKLAGREIQIPEPDTRPGVMSYQGAASLVVIVTITAAISQLVAWWLAVVIVFTLATMHVREGNWAG